MIDAIANGNVRWAHESPLETLGDMETLDIAAWRVVIFALRSRLIYKVEENYHTQEAYEIRE
jgi:hypothetical protein